jgi:CHAT domain-containing protein
LSFCQAGEHLPLNTQGATRGFIDLADGGRGRWNHPHFWAPYILMGDPWTMPLSS